MFLNVDSVILFFSLFFTKRDFFFWLFSNCLSFFFLNYFIRLIIFLVRVNGLNEVNMASSPPHTASNRLD